MRNIIYIHCGKYVDNICKNCTSSSTKSRLKNKEPYNTCVKHVVNHNKTALYKQLQSTKKSPTFSVVEKLLSTISTPPTITTTNLI